MDTRGRTLCLITTLVCFVNGTASWGQQTYNPTASDPKTGNTAGGTGALPSNRRQIFLALLMTLGLLLGERHVAQAASFTFTPINVPGASFTRANGITPSGQIVGSYVDSTGALHGFLYAGGVFTPIDVPGASFTQAFGITPSGQIVGDYLDSTGTPHGFLATPRRNN